MNTPKSRPDSDPTLDELVRQNPVYRDTPLGQGEVELMPRRLRSPANFGRPRKLLWKWLGLPEPRAIVRALMIDGYPKDIRRWAYERMETGIHWISFVGGMAVAALVACSLQSLIFHLQESCLPFLPQQYCRVFLR